MSKSKRQNRAPVTGAVITNPKQDESKPATVATKATVTVADSPAVVEAKAALAKAKQAAKDAEAQAKATAKAAREAERAAKPKPEPRPVCAGTKKDGTACTSRAIAGSDRCIDHQPAFLRLTPEELAAFTGWLKAAQVRDVIAELGWFRAKELAKLHMPTKANGSTTVTHETRAAA